MTMSSNNEWNELSGGNFVGKSLFILHWFIFILAVFLFIFGQWKLAIIVLGIGLVMVLMAYRLAGGRQNVAIWKNKDLYELLKHAFLIGEAKIGFHTHRDQNLLLTKLESIGARREPSENMHQFIRDKIVTNRQAFDICREYIIIQMIHKGNEWFWDGYGIKRTAQYFHEVEIIFDIKSSVAYMFSEVLEGLKNENSGKEN